MAEPKILRVVFPPGITTMEDKHRYLFASQETLRQEHNAKGADFREGKITEKEFRDYQRLVFGPKSDALSVAITGLRSTIKAEYTDQDINGPLFADVDLANTFKEIPR